MFPLEKGLESAIRSTQAMFAQNIDLLHNLTEKEIDGLSVSVPTIQMPLNPGNYNKHSLFSFVYLTRFFLFVRTYTTRRMHVSQMFFK